MGNRSFAVETLGQAVLIFGGPEDLVTPLIQSLLARGVQGIKVESLAQLHDLKNAHDLDFLVVFQDEDHTPYLPTLSELLSSGESRLILVEHLGQGSHALPLSPVSKHISYLDYVSETHLASPLLNSWISSAQSHQKLIIPGDGLSDFSLLTHSDLSQLLSRAILSPLTQPGEEFALGNPLGISLLNLAYLVRTSFTYKIDLVFDQNSPSSVWPFDSDLLESNLVKLEYQPLDDAEIALKSFLKSLGSLPVVQSPLPLKKIAIPAPANPTLAPPVFNPMVEPVKPTPPPIPKKLTPLRQSQPVFVPLQPRRVLPSFKFSSFARSKHAGPPRATTIVGRGLVLALALYLGTLAFTFTISLLSLRGVYRDLSSGELPHVTSLNHFTTTYLEANWVVLTSVPGISGRKAVTEFTLLLDAYSQALSAFKTGEALSLSTQELTHYIFGTGSADVAQLVSLSRLQSEELYQQLSLLDGSLPDLPPSLIPVKYRPLYQGSKVNLGTLKRSVITSKALLATIPDIIGLGGRRKYGVLFQNNMELRATGGFIGSFAILSFENGKLYDMPIFDVYDADGQLKGHVEPPGAIKEILGEANWYLRDSNFDPDFPTSARRAEWFIKKSLNQDLDGTIAVNVNTLVGLLRATGPLTIPDYNETITGDNLYERAQFHAEVNFFPGSTQKKEFLSTVANALFARFPTLGAGEGLKLVAALSQTIQEKNTLISLTNTATDHVFATLGWNGQLSDLPCPSTSACHKDYAMVVDSNFGVNKANYFIKRDIEAVITFDKDLAVNHVLRLTYQNTSTSTAWPAGAYKNYQRLYLPIGATITKVSLGDRVLTPQDYTLSIEHGKFILAYLVTVPINSTQQVVVEYATPSLASSSELLYTWYWQKQPGTSSSDRLNVYLNYPLYLKPLVISPTAALAPQQLKFEFTNDTDHRLTVKFTK